MTTSAPSATPPPLFTGAPATDSSDTSTSGLRQRHASKKVEDEAKLQAIIGAAKDATPPAMTAYLKQLEPAVNVLVNMLVIVAPLYARAAEILVAAYHSLPMDLIEAAMGLGMCFFGGAYCASIAAVEAFMLIGKDLHAPLLDIYDDALRIKAATERDDKQPPAADGEQAQAAERIKHKVHVAALAVRDPEKLTRAVGGVYVGWLLVQGTLRLQFARTVTLGISIAKMLDPLIMRFGLPVLAHALPADLHHWLPTLLRTACKTVAVALSWYLQVGGPARALPAASVVARPLADCDMRLRPLASGDYLGGAVVDQGWPPLRA